MKRLLVLLTVLNFITFAQQDIQISTRGPYQVLTRSAAWGVKGQGGIENAYLLQPLNPSQGICIFVSNLNPTSTHSLNLSVYQTGDPNVDRYYGNTGRWVQDTVQGFSGTVAAKSTTTAYVHTSAAARIAVTISGTSTQTGSPDKADVYLVQTDHTSCGPVGTGAQYIQGSQAVGSSVDQTNPVLVAGSDGTYTQNISTDSYGRIKVESARPISTSSIAPVSLQAVPTSLTSLFGSTVYLVSLYLSNTTSSAITVNVTDGQATPVYLLNSFSIPANSALMLPNIWVRMTNGVKWSASASGVTGGLWVAW